VSQPLTEHLFKRFREMTPSGRCHREGVTSGDNLLFAKPTALHFVLLFFLVPRTTLIDVVHFHCGLSVRLHACSPPHLTVTQLARSSVLNGLIVERPLNNDTYLQQRAERPVPHNIGPLVFAIR
jgi:hypothetical protein